MNRTPYYENCRLCPRRCQINRTDSSTAGTGFCRESDQLRVGYIGPHFGEEPPISGKNGSGTVFLSGCSLKCSFCQNYQISHEGLGRHMRLEELLSRLVNMIELQHVHNINFVTPDHFFPHINHLVRMLRNKGHDLPVVFNTSGYQSLEMLRPARDCTDIYLPDFKYSDLTLAANLSKCREYPNVALDAITEMVRQKGFLDVFQTHDKLAGKGVLVRHMILPGYVENSINALSSLFIEFGKGLPVSLMSQYHPVQKHDNENLNRKIRKQEFYRVYTHAQELGFDHLFVQFPEKEPDYRSQASPYLPDFKQAEPFG